MADDLSNRLIPFATFQIVLEYKMIILPGGLAVKQSKGTIYIVPLQDF